MDQEYKSVCDTCGRKTWYNRPQQCHCTYAKSKTCDTCGHTEVIEPVRMVRCTGNLRLIDNSELDERLTPFYNNKQRIKITYKDNSVIRCTVGKSTGWKPIYLAIKRVNSTGGEGILTNFIKSVAVV